MSTGSGGVYRAARHSQQSSELQCLSRVLAAALDFLGRLSTGS